MRRSGLAVAFILLLLVFSALFYLRQSKEWELETVDLAGEKVAATPAPPTVHYPVPADGREGEPPLPPLGESDPAVQQRLGALVADSSLRQLFLPDQLIRRLVVTVDNLPRKFLPPKYLPLQRPAGAFLARGEGASLVIDPSGYRRYAPYVRLAEVADTGRLVTAYVQLYPLFQQAYEELGYPEGYFNDRLVEVLDHLLAAPRVREPVQLAPTTLGFRFADPALENLSAGQKLLIRIGPENASRIGKKLQELRNRVAAMPKE